MHHVRESWQKMRLHPYYGRLSLRLIDAVYFRKTITRSAHINPRSLWFRSLFDFAFFPLHAFRAGLSSPFSVRFSRCIARYPRTILLCNTNSYTNTINTRPTRRVFATIIDQDATSSTPSLLCWPPAASSGQPQFYSVAALGIATAAAARLVATRNFLHF